MPLSYGKVATISGAILIGVAAGYLLRKGSEPLHADSEPVVADRATRSPAREVHSLAQGFSSSRLDERTLHRLERLEKLAFDDPTRALRQLDSFADFEIQGLALAAIGRGWGERDPAAAARWIEGLDAENDQVNAALGLVPVWTERQPEDAFSWSLGREEGSVLREISLLEVADMWSSHFPRQAMERFLAMPEEVGGERGLHVISTQWAVSAPEEAIGYFSTMDPDKRRDEFLESVLVSLTNENPELSWRKAHLLGDAVRIAHVQSQALEAMAEVQPQEALRLAATAGDLKLNYRGIARGWAYSNRQEAQAWAGSLEDLELRNVAMEEIREITAGTQMNDEEE